MTGLSFDLTAVGQRRWNSPSIDRIDSKLGYTIGNVRFILWSLNATAWLANKARIECEVC